MARNASEPAKKRADNASMAHDADDVDKIRDIIFGGQMREYAARFEQLEKSIVARVDRLSADLEKRLEQLATKLTAEKDERKASDAAVRTQIRDSEKQMKAAIAESGSGWAAEAVELHNTMVAESEELAGLIDKAKAELITSIQDEVGRLDQQKVATRDLAQLFTDIGRELKQESK